ncbi:PAS domain-containing sensor histidine kinase [Niveibacterium terrae]|uniref:PAS domain-containing sensor histidine kinase n=1 Tax=Niveibacterium terrae TaxID=3373598 RepID=UPI003A8E5865
MSPLSAKTLASLVDHCGQALLAIDPLTLNIVFANADAARMFECAPEELIGSPISRVETGMADHFFWEEVRNGRSSERAPSEGFYRGFRGGRRTVEKSITKEELDGRTLLVLRAHDISRSRIAEELSAHTASLLAATFEATADGLLVTDAQGRVQNFNRRFAALFGLAPEIGVSTKDAELAEQLLARLAEPADWPELQIKLAQNPDQQIRQQLALIDGRQLECVISPQRLNQQTIGHVWCFSDITARVRYEAALLAARDAADSANHAKSRFLAAMSHELKTPLNAILGFSDLLGLDEHPDQEDSIRLIRQAGAHLLELINQVLELARADAGRITLNPAPLAADQFIAEACEIVEPLASQKKVRLEYAGGAAPQVIGDALRVRQVMLNLLSNAIKYNHPNGWVRISHRELAEGRVKYLHIAVEDDGRGISEADQARLFEPFVRAADSSGDVEGTGLGLALTQRLVHLMDGRIGVESTLGRGSRFWIELPTV